MSIVVGNDRMSMRWGLGQIAKRWRVVVLTIVATLAVAGPASAEDFMSNQGLSAGNAYASGSAHSGIWFVYVNSDHTACPAYSSGWGGYTSTPFSGGHSLWYNNNDCGYGGVSWYPTTSACCYYHGAVYNPNTSTFDNVELARYYFG